jgi:chemotaxis methyl-accepting protein methylase
MQQSMSMISMKLDILPQMIKVFSVFESVMSTEATWPIMQRGVDLGARFLVKKPLDTIAIRNIWQYLDQRLQRMEKIKTLFKGYN